ncbi:hypothetical protein [Nitrosospira multiformis]|nr:hypothetical protein [Nitrosospira multiformis]
MPLFNCILPALAIYATIASSFGHAQAPPNALQLKQLRNGDKPQVMTAVEIAGLGDPVFKLLLKDKADRVTLADVQDAIQPNTANRHLFIVSERIVQAAKTGTRRAVVAFDGANAGETLKGNVMLSVSFGPNGFPKEAEIEAWGWDDKRGRYNYYKLDAAGSSRGGMVWKFRGSSEKADLLTTRERAGTCLRCHVSGAPIMKELFFPWNNWHAGVGGSFFADYLDPASPRPDKWPAANTSPFMRLSMADKLETDFLIPSFKRFNRSRLNAVLRQNASGSPSISPAGTMTVLEGTRLLRPLFQTTEINLISSRNTSGLPPFGRATDFLPRSNIQIPASFFLNVQLIAGGGTGGLGGLKLIDANRFSTFKLSQQENKDLVEKFNLLLDGVRGDTHFAWFVPEPGFVENDLVDQALQLGVVTPHFVAAVLAVDLEKPVFSSARAELLKFVPDEFEFIPVPRGTDPLTVQRDPEKDFLTQEVISRIGQGGPDPGTNVDEFRKLLASPDAVAELEKRVKAYVERIQAALDPAANGSNGRKAELERLYGLLVERRRLMEAHPVLQNLDETEGRLLFPLPTRD